MALLPSIMSLFGGPKTPPASPVQSTPTSQVVAAGANPSIPSQTTPVSNGSNPAIPAVGGGDSSPLANYQDLWKTDPNAKTDPATIVPNFNLDHKGLFEAAGKINFTQGVSEELFTKALSGDVEAFKAVLNESARYGYAAAASTSGELVKNSLSSAEGLLNSRVLPSAFRNQQISQALETNPVFQDPAVAPLLGSLTSQLSQKYPTAPASEIAAKAAEYLAGMSEKIVSATGGSIVSQQQNSRNNRFAVKETNWEEYMNS